MSYETCHWFSMSIWWKECSLTSLANMQLKCNEYMACPMGEGLICFGVVTLIFKVTEVMKVTFSIWSITQNVLEISTWNLVDTCLRSSKMPIHFGVTGIKYGVTEWKKVKIVQIGVSCPALHSSSAKCKNNVQLDCSLSYSKLPWQPMAARIHTCLSNHKVLHKQESYARFTFLATWLRCPWSIWRTSCHALVWYMFYLWRIDVHCHILGSMLLLTLDLWSCLTLKFLWHHLCPGVEIEVFRFGMWTASHG